MGFGSLRSVKRHTRNRLPRQCLLEGLERRVLLTATLSSYVPTAVASFPGGSGVGSPAGIVIDSAGNIFGVTTKGGARGKGSVFEILAGTNTVITLASFTGANGATPLGQLILDGNGDLFGVTAAGGAAGRGTVFELVAGSHTIAPLVSFNGSRGRPSGALVGTLDASGNGTLHGTTVGGSGQAGAVFNLTLGVGLADLTFAQSFAPGLTPGGSLAMDSSGNLFGITVGKAAQKFEVLANGFLNFSAPLTGSTAGQFGGGVVLDSSGNLFATTTNGGASKTGGLWKFDTSLQSATLVASFGATTGKTPFGTLVQDAAGNIFGVTASGNGGLWEWGNGSAAITSIATLNKTSGQKPSGALALFGDGLFGLASGGGTSGAGTVFNSAMTRLAISQPAATTVGALGTLTVAVQDPLGNVITSDASNVTLTVSNGATLGGTTTVAAVNGIATFTDLTLTKSGTFTLTATAGVFARSTTAAFTLAPGAATQLAFVQQPINQTTGVKFALSVAVEDQFGNVVTTDNSLVTIGVASGPAGGVLSGTTTLQAKKGVASFNNLVLQVPGTYALVASNSNALTTATSNTFTIAGPATQIVFTQQPPTSGVAGMTFSVAAQLEDVNGNVVTGDHSKVSLAIASGPSQGAVIQAKSATNGVLTFSNILWKLAGTFTLKVTNGKATGAVSGVMTVAPGPATKLKIVSAFPPFPTVIPSGTIGPVVVKLQDAYGNNVTNPLPVVTLPPVVNGVGWITSGTFAVGDTVRQTNINAIVNAIGTYLGTDSSGNTLLQVTTGSFSTTGTITDVTTLATLTPQGPTTANTTTVGTTVTLTYATQSFPQVIQTATAPLVSGTATFSGLPLTTPGFYYMTATTTGVAAGTTKVFVK